MPVVLTRSKRYKKAAEKAIATPVAVEQAVEAVNHPKDYMAARKLIAERARPDPGRLADPSVAMKDSV